MTRQLLREKRLEEFSNPAKGEATKEDPKAEDFVDDDEFWRQSLAEATLNSVLEKMVRRSSYSVLSLCKYVLALRWDNSRIFQGARNRNWAPARPLFMPTHSQSNYKGPIRTFHNY